MNYTRFTVRWLARIGYGARGLVYIVVGGIALHAAFDVARAKDVRGSLKSMTGLPGGQTLLFALAAGFLAYGIWRAVQSLLDVDRHGHGAGALLLRGALLTSAAIYASLAWGCLKIATYSGGGSGQPVQHMVAQTLEWPWGSWLVIAGGIVVAIVGIAHFHKAATGGFLRWFDAPEGALWLIDPVSRVGLFARGLLFAGVAGFVVYSAFTLDPESARGVHGVLAWLQNRLYGQIMLGVLAIGLIAFGCYSVIEALVRRVGLGPKSRSAAIR